MDCSAVKCGNGSLCAFRVRGGGEEGSNSGATELTAEEKEALDEGLIALDGISSYY